MTVPYLTPRFHPLPPVNAGGTGLDVRVGAGRPVRYAFAGPEFKVGGAAGCELRLTGANLPPLVCQITRTPDGLVLRRADPAFPILVNGTPAPADTDIPVGHGDRVAVGSADVTVHIGSVHLHPHLNAQSEPPGDARLRAYRPDANAPPADPPPPGYGPDTTARLAELTEAAAELEAERAIWYRRRAEIEAECDAVRAEAARLAEALPDLDARQAELDKFQAELVEVRRGLAEQYQERRDQLAQMQDVVRGAAAELQARQDAFDAAHAARTAELDERERRLAETAAPVVPPSPPPEQIAELEARRAEVDRRAAEADARFDQLVRDAAALEAHAQAAAVEHDRLAGVRDELTREAADLAAGRVALAERLAAADQWQAEQTQLAQAAADRAAALDADLRERAAVLDAHAGRAADVTAVAAALEAREAAVEQRSAKLREVGRAVAGTKRDIAAGREALAAADAEIRQARAEVEARFTELQQAQADLDAQRGELQQARADMAAEFAGLRDRLPALAADADAQLRAGADDLARREQALETATVEHRLAAAGFRQQVLDWQAEIDAARRAAETAAARPAVRVAAPAPDRTLADLREWYARKFRDVAGPSAGPRPADPPDPGDRHLGELLQSHGLADADIVGGLYAEAARQRRPLRAVLLSSGAVTLYQLALVESGNLAALALGRLRVVDRLRVTPREVVYRVVDPHRTDGPNGGVHVLRHLSEAEMDDAVRPDEFRQRFAAARDAAHLNLAQTVEVLEINGRPAVLCEAPAGLPSGDWPADAAIPGVWVRLLTNAAAGLDAAHRHGLPHGRLSTESFVLTPAGELKVVGVGEPMWLATGVAAATDPTPAADLRALGPVAFGWAQLAQPPGRRRTRGKAFPEPLLNVIRRLEADPETPMGDTAAGAAPYADTAELLADLARQAAAFPCAAADWDRLVSHAAAPAEQVGVNRAS